MKKVGRMLNTHEKEWLKNFNWMVARGDTTKLVSFFGRSEEDAKRITKEIEYSRNAFRRDVTNKLDRLGLAFYEEDTSAEYNHFHQEDNMVSLVDFSKQTKIIDLHDLDIGDCVEVRIPNHVYDKQRGVIIDVSKSGYLIEIITKRPPGLKRDDNTKGRIILKKSDVIRRSNIEK